jgi:hypothetical protein
MKRQMIIALGLMALAVQATFACNEHGSTGFVEENNLYISVADKNNLSGINEQEFNDVITKIETIYAPIVASKGGKLVVQRNWTDGTVNAYASQSGSTWMVAMFGGLARHETITADGLALVVCHEIGHHIGGFPKKGGWLGAWASNEGQSDYFANLKCLRRAFVNDDNATIVRNLKAPASLTNSCKASYSNTEDYLICVRGGMAGLSVAKLFQALRNQTVAPDFATPDKRVAASTDHNHPDTQCRLDTYFQGSLCDADLNTDVSNTDEKMGTCHRANNDTVGLRPLCWFKPRN